MVWYREDPSREKEDSQRAVYNLNTHLHSAEAYQSKLNSGAAMTLEEQHHTAAVRARTQHGVAISL